MTKKSKYLILGLVSVILFISLFPVINSQFETDTPKTSNITRDYKILSEIERSKITQNQQIADTVTKEILLSLVYGEFFEYDWIPSLESTYHGLYILQTTGGLG